MYSVADICLKHQKPEMNLFNQTKSGGGKRTRKKEPVNTREDVETIMRKQEKERKRNLAQ